MDIDRYPLIIGRLEKILPALEELARAHANGPQEAELVEFRGEMLPGSPALSADAAALLEALVGKRVDIEAVLGNISEVAADLARERDALHEATSAAVDVTAECQRVLEQMKGASSAAPTLGQDTAAAQTEGYASVDKIAVEGHADQTKAPEQPTPPSQA